MERAQVRWLWAGWGVSATLGFLMPLYRGTAHLYGGIVVAASIAVMALVSLATRRPLVSLTMSAFGMVFGAAIGFALLAHLTHRGLPAALSGQMLLGSLLLGRSFRRELRSPASIADDGFFERLRDLPPEEAKPLLEARIAALKGDLDGLRRGSNIATAAGLSGLAAVAIVLLGGLNHPRNETALYAATPFLAATLILALLARRALRSGGRR